MEGASTSGATAATGNGGNANASATNAAAESTTNTQGVNNEGSTEKKAEKKEKSQRDLFYERHKNDFPDDDEADEELFYKRHNERMAEYDKLKKNDGDFRKVITEHPQFGGMFLDAADGKDFFESLFGRFSEEEIMDAYHDPDKRKKISETYAGHLKSQAESKKLREEGEANIKETIARFNKYCEKNGIEGDEAMAIWNQMNDFYSDGLKGKYSDTLFDMMRKASAYDSDVENARAEGQLAGHNAKVQTTLAKGKAPKGLPPTFDGGQGAAGAEAKPKNKKVVRNPFTNEDMEIEE